MRASVRLPLQVGTTSSWSILRAALSLVPGGVVLSWVPAWFRQDQGAQGGGALLGGGFLVLYAVQQLVRAWQSRPSDAVLDSGGVRFEGGRMDGVVLPWAAIDGDRTCTEDSRGLRLSITRLVENAIFLFFSTLLANSPELAPEPRQAARRLKLVTRDGREWIAAVAEKPGEQQSMDALVGSMRAKMGVEPKAETAAPQGVMTCAGCGAPLTPTDAAAATCHFCSRTTAVPVELRERLSAQLALAQSRVETEKLVETLLRQPGAGRASTVLAVTAAGVTGAWGMALAPLWLAGVDDVGGFEVGVALLAGVLASMALVSLGNAGLVNRRALRLLTSSFGARLPADPRAAPQCRRCGAPLPSSERTLVGCVYCGAENILGLDLRAHVAPTREHPWSLEQLFASRQRQRSRALRAAAVTLCSGSVAGLALVASVMVASEFSQKKRLCLAGDAVACTGVARTYSTGSTVAKDEDKAAVFYQRACTLNDAEGCLGLSQAYRWGAGVAADPGHASTLRERACTLGQQEACTPDG